MVVGAFRTSLSASSYSELDRNPLELLGNPFTENMKKGSFSTAQDDGSSGIADHGDPSEDPGDSPKEREENMKKGSSSTAQDDGSLGIADHGDPSEDPGDPSKEIEEKTEESSTSMAPNSDEDGIDPPKEIEEKTEESSTSMASNSGAEGIEGFDRELLHDFKSGFQPLFVRNPTTTIYSVPERIYNLKPKIYEYRYRYFGIVMNFDMFYPKSSLKNNHMLAHMQSILSRNGNNIFEDYLSAMEEMKDRIRMCHLIKIKVDFKCFIALVLSCCHILDVLLLFFEGRLTPLVDQSCSTAMHELCTDMLLVHSQIPFFALQKIYDMLDLDHSLYPSLMDLSVYFFGDFFHLNQKVKPMPSEIHHLVHLVHYRLLPDDYVLKQQETNGSFVSHNLHLSIPVITPSKQPRTISPIPCARRLRDAGIKFRKKKSTGFSNITFHRGVLEIPYLHVDNHTEVLLRNLIAWEQSHPNVGAYFTCYGIFMDFIINTAEDVEILNRHGILEQTLGSEEEVADVFNGLSTNIFYSRYENDFLPSVRQELNKYCEDKFNIWKANLINDYFGNPWAIISVVAAIFLLFLTSTQTFFSAFAYFRPP